MRTVSHTHGVNVRLIQRQQILFSARFQKKRDQYAVTQVIDRDVPPVTKTAGTGTGTATVSGGRAILGRSAWSATLRPYQCVAWRRLVNGQSGKSPPSPAVDVKWR